VGSPAPLRAKKIFFRHNLQGKCVSAPPGHEVHRPVRAGVKILGQFLLGGLDLEVYLDVFETIKKVVNFFGKKKCTPQAKSWLCLCQKGNLSL